MGSSLSHELERLVVGTNDQRRRVGQAFFHFYKTLIFWMRKDEITFFDTTRSWSASGAAIFDAMATTLRDLQPHEEDEALRAFVSQTFLELARDLERGDHTCPLFVRWLEARFPALTEMMREESPESRIFDHGLAVDLSGTFTLMAGADRQTMVALLRERADAVILGQRKPGGR